jgi:diguanylate cyclase (GGDEF)-like protein/PAS domain S-box-containing protein
MEQGYTVRAVMSGAMALKSVQVDIPDIILLDINMPGMNGYEVCKHLKRNIQTRHVPVIFISALDEVMNKVEAFQVGGADYITKPFHVEEVLVRIETQLTALHAKEELRKFQRAVEQSPVSVMITDTDGKVEYVNPKFTQVTGYTFDEVDGRKSYILNPDDTSSDAYQELWTTVPSGGEWRGEFRNTKKNGEVFWESATVSPVFNEHDTITHFLAVKEDITERKRSESELAQMNDQLKRWVSELEQYNRELTLLNGMGESLQVCMTVEEAYRVAKQTASQLFTELSGALYILDPQTQKLQAVETWGEHKDRLAQVLEASQALSRQGTQFFEKQELPTDKACSLPYIIPSLCVPLTAQSDTFGVLSLYRNSHDQIQEYERWERLAIMVADHLALALTNLHLRERLREQSIRDSLTGLFNRRYLDEILQRELSRAIRHQQPIGIILLDIDHFKRYNDTYGHEGGDAVLRSMGTFLQNGLRKEDIACRYGGEEFVLVLPGASLEDTARKAEELCSLVRGMHVEHEGISLGRITISLGVSCFPLHGTTADSIISIADSALYRAKETGRNRVIVADYLHPVNSSPPGTTRRS